MIDFSILFEDGEALVIDKPAGLPLDPPRAGGDSLENHLDALRFGFQREPHPVHRLDQDTSGCLLLARGRAGGAFDLERDRHAFPPRSKRARLRRSISASSRAKCRATAARSNSRSARSARPRRAGA